MFNCLFVFACLVATFFRFLPPYLVTYLIANMFTCLLAYLLTCLLAYLLNCLIAYLFTYLVPNITHLHVASLWQKSVDAGEHGGQHQHHRQVHTDLRRIGRGN